MQIRGVLTMRIVARSVDCKGMSTVHPQSNENLERTDEALEERLREAEGMGYEAVAKYEALLEQLPAAIYSYAPELDGPTFQMSRFVEELLGVSSEEFLSREEIWDELIHPDDRERSRMDYESYLRTGQPEGGEYRYVRPDGRVVWVYDRSATIRDASGEPMFIQGVMFDITQRKEAELRMQHMAYHDALTGSPNRVRFEEHLDLALARARRDGLSVAVLFLDIDDFKIVNDTHGHASGDEVLRQLAARLRSAVRETDLVARQGGDEFLVLVADLPQGARRAEPRAAIDEVAERISQALAMPFRLHVGELSIRASVGCGLYPFDADDGDQLIRHADELMYEQKRDRVERSALLRHSA